MKFIFAFSFFLLALMFLLIVENERWKQRCHDAGGVPAASVCVNPSAVIEVD